MPAAAMPAAEVDIDEALVRRLLAEQHPDLGGLPLIPAGFGWDNVVFRLGADFAVRLPRRAVAVPLLEHEQRWLAELAPRLPLAVPAPVRTGLPGCGYPWPWSVCRWVPGEMAEGADLDLDAAVDALAGFVTALHVPAPDGAPANPYRGVPLAARSGITESAIAAFGDDFDGRAVLALWRRLVVTPPWSGPPLWLHGDLHPANLVVSQARLTGVIDFGDLTSGDPATDLAVAWMLFPPSHREAFRRRIPASDPGTWARARGWALALALACLANSADNPVIAGIGRRTLAAALDG